MGTMASGEIDSHRQASGLDSGFRRNLGHLLLQNPARFECKTYRGKRLLDCAIALPLLIASFPAMMLTAIWIRLQSPGPVIYRQTRLGLGGRPFTLYKLRTMAVDCEKQTGPCWSLPNDRRVIPGGHFLRCWHFDELPQFWNILRGDMSLVGPRPERAEIAERLEASIPEVVQRLAILPGLTGLAQVTLPADSDLIGFQRKIDLDLKYVADVSLKTDLRILRWTFLKVLGLRASWVYPKVGHA